MRKPSECNAASRHCKLPRFWLRRFRHRAWICDCGTAWRTRPTGWVWTWEQWRAADAMEVK